ncbi:MAG: MAE_28990/MAE_18760 family HEPN-like nuclease [Candidatus Aminicenantes bacterium]|jgi:hypothetical protein
MERKLAEQINKLDSIFGSVSVIYDEELLSHYAKYLCILTSGLIENSLKIILNDYSSKASAPNIANYLNNQFKNITNLKDSKIQSILGCFSQEWKEEYLSKISSEQKDALDSLVTNRNQIAHGHNVGITYVRVKEYYKQIKDVIYLLKEIICK